MSFPDVLTHIFDPARGPFRNLCALPANQAKAVLDTIRRAGHRRPGPTYLSRRLAVEDWLIREARRLGRTVRLAHPLYFFLGDYEDGLDRSRPASIKVPLALIPEDRLTFTYPDSMASLPLGTDPDLAPQRRDHHGRVMTLAELMRVVARTGLPDRTGPRPPGVLSDGFIEAQLWDDAPLRALLGLAAFPSL